MNSKEMYIEAVAHWDDIYLAYKNNNVGMHEDADIHLKSGEIIGFGRHGCVYCDRFWAARDCGNCPISEASDCRHCKGTPYYGFTGSPSADTALEEREFIRKNPPAGVEIMEIEDIRKQRSNHETK